MEQDLRVTSRLEFSRFVDTDEAGKQVVSWDAVLIEAQIAIVHGVVAELDSYVSDLDTRKDFVVFEAADRYDERLGSIVLPVGFEPREDNCVGSVDAE